MILNSHLSESRNSHGYYSNKKPNTEGDKFLLLVNRWNLTDCFENHDDQPKHFIHFRKLNIGFFRGTTSAKHPLLARNNVMER